MARKTKKARRDIYKEITDRVIASMESDNIAPWVRPWNRVGPDGGAPCNAVSGKAYRGVNVLLCMLTAWERGYTSNKWLTFKQAHEIAAKAARKAGHKVEEKEIKRGRYTKKVYVYAEGENKGKTVGGVKPGQNKSEGKGSTDIIFSSRGKKTEKQEDGTEKERTWFTVRFYQVFNLDQCIDSVREYVEGPKKEEPADKPEFNPIAACEEICAGFDVTTAHGGNRAYYRASTDAIQLPEREQFKTPEAYYTTRFHEMGHATGHASRLARPGIVQWDGFGSHSYSYEELVAEFTATLLAGEAGIVRTVEDNSAAYLKGWASKLKEDPKLIYNAAREAQKAADLVLGVSFASDEKSDDSESEAA